MHYPDARAESKKGISAVLDGVNATISSTSTEGLSEIDTANVLVFNDAWPKYATAVMEYMDLIDKWTARSCVGIYKQRGKSF